MAILSMYDRRMDTSTKTNGNIGSGVAGSRRGAAGVVDRHNKRSLTPSRFHHHGMDRHSKTYIVHMDARNETNLIRMDLSSKTNVITL